METINGSTRTTQYAYDDDNRVTSVSTNGISESYSYDAYGRITGYYNTTTFQFTGGMSVRNWLAGQSYDVQFDFGMNVLCDLGVIP